MQGLPTRYDHTNTDRAFTMESLKILEVAIEEWVLVVPLYFQGNSTVISSPHMVDLVRNHSPFPAIDGFSDDDVAFDPIQFGQGSSEALGETCLAATAADQFHIRDSYRREGGAQFAQRHWEVPDQNRLRMVLGLHVETRAFELGQVQEDTTIEL